MNLRVAAFGLAYAGAAVFSVSLTRIGDGIAMFWIATGLLVPWLIALPIQRWGPSLVASWIASFFVTGTLGLGWQLAPILATANCAEAAFVALLSQAAFERFRSFTSFAWMAIVVLGGGVLAPSLSGTLAVSAIAWFTGASFFDTFQNWILSHGLGFVCIFPVAGLLVQARMRHRSVLPEPGKRAIAAGSLIAVTAAGIACFGQSNFPLLFLPLVVLMYAMVLTNLTVSAAAMFIVVVMAVASAFLGSGPLALTEENYTGRFYYLEVYILCVALTGIPIALMLERRRKMFAELVESEARYRLLADFSTDIVMVTGLRGEIRFVSPSIRQLGDHDPEALIGIASEILVAKQHRVELAEAHRRVMKNPGSTASIEFLGLTRASGTRWMEAHLRGIFREDGSVDGVCSIVRDISKRKRRESELGAVLLSDPLTGLANRRAFEGLIATGNDDDESYVAVFDLDHFKRINDQFGHAIGDIVIQAFARAARSVMRESDPVARIGGEEFAMHLRDTTLEQARLVCERIRGAFVQEAQLAAPQVGLVSASVGISRCDGLLPDVMRQADAALHQAKAEGRDRLAIAA